MSPKSDNSRCRIKLNWHRWLITCFRSDRASKRSLLIIIKMRSSNECGLNSRRRVRDRSTANWDTHFGFKGERTYGRNNVLRTSGIGCRRLCAKRAVGWWTTNGFGWRSRRKRDEVYAIGQRKQRRCTQNAKGHEARRGTGPPAKISQAPKPTVFYEFPSATPSTERPFAPSTESFAQTVVQCRRFKPVTRWSPVGSLK